LGELQSKFGYCLAPNQTEAILANPPSDAAGFVDAVLTAEGRDVVYVSESEKRDMQAIVTKWAVYDLPEDAIAERPAFPIGS
jgi:hypothetical protein